jgi:hypothetical protein
MTSYTPATGILCLPRVEVGAQHFSATLKLMNSPSALNFKLDNASPIPAGGLNNASFAGSLLTLPAVEVPSTGAGSVIETHKAQLKLIPNSNPYIFAVTSVDKIPDASGCGNEPTKESDNALNEKLNSIEDFVFRNATKELWDRLDTIVPASGVFRPCDKPSLQEHLVLRGLKLTSAVIFGTLAKSNQLQASKFRKVIGWKFSREALKDITETQVKSAIGTQILIDAKNALKSPLEFGIDVLVSGLILKPFEEHMISQPDFSVREANVLALIQVTTKALIGTFAGKKPPSIALLEAELDVALDWTAKDAALALEISEQFINNHETEANTFVMEASYKHIKFLQEGAANDAKKWLKTGWPYSPIREAIRPGIEQNSNNYGTQLLRIWYLAYNGDLPGQERSTWDGIVNWLTFRGAFSGSVPYLTEIIAAHERRVKILYSVFDNIGAECARLDEASCLALIEGLGITSADNRIVSTQPVATETSTGINPNIPAPQGKPTTDVAPF